jgi:hypothetical protein
VVHAKGAGMSLGIMIWCVVLSLWPEDLFNFEVKFLLIPSEIYCKYSQNSSISFLHCTFNPYL